MGAKDAFGLHAESKFAPRHSSILHGRADVLLEIVVGVDCRHMLASIAARDGTGLRDILTMREGSLLLGSFAHFISLLVCSEHQCADGKLREYSSLNFL